MKICKILLLSMVCLLIACKGKSEDECCTGTGNPVIVASDVEVTESDVSQIVAVTVQIEGEVTTNIVARYSTINGTALNGIDFKKVEDDTIVFSASEKSFDIELEIFGDNDQEGDETFEVRFFSTSASFSEKKITVIIKNDDDAFTDLAIPNGYSTPSNYPGMNLVWSDEFTGTVLNESDWTFEIGDGCPDLCGWGNNELEYYQRENVYFKDNDYMIIQAREEQVGNRQYTSSRIITQGKQSFQYGRIDMRAVLPEGQGIWPAFWMLGESISSISWPRCGEIDIMELVGNAPGRAHGTVHWGDSFAQRDSKGSSETLPSGEKYIEEFHVFSLEWKEDEMKFYVDDELFLTVDPTDMNGQNYPFNAPFFFIFNIAVGGNWPGSPNSATSFPQHMIVDYVRVFQ